MFSLVSLLANRKKKMLSQVQSLKCLEFITITDGFIFCSPFFKLPRKQIFLEWRYQWKYNISWQIMFSYIHKHIYNILYIWRLLSTLTASFHIDHAHKNFTTYLRTVKSELHSSGCYLCSSLVSLRSWHNSANDTLRLQG